MIRLVLSLGLFIAACSNTTTDDPTTQAQLRDLEPLPGSEIDQENRETPGDATLNDLSPGPDGMTLTPIYEDRSVIEELLRDAGSTVPPSPVMMEAQRFHEISERFVGNAAKRRYGIAVSDFDTDGDFELIVTGYGGANEVWDAQGDRLVDIAPADLKDSERRAIGVAACDLDGDGQEEIYFLNVDRFGGLGEVSDRLYRRSGDGWVDVFEQAENATSVNRFSGRSVLCFDRDGDGAYGVFVANYGGPMKLFEVDDGWSLRDLAPELGMALTTGGRSLINLPTAEGQMQIFAGNENGPNFFFAREGTRYREVAEEYGISDHQETVRGVAVLDADEDELFDLVYGNWNGPHRLFLRRADGFVESAPQEMTAPSPIRTVIAADFDNDGYEEIFWNQIGAANRLFKKIDGAWVSVDLGPALEPEGLGTGAAVADLDGDGRLELFIAHGESGAQPLTAFRWGANQNHFLRVLPRTRSGGPARGAIVIVRGATRSQRRVIDAGSGYLCQMEPVAHFGLGAEVDMVSVEVIWPDGSRTQRADVQPDQRLIIDYPVGG